MIRKINLFVKRVFDILAGIIGLIITFPILCIAILGIFITMPGSIFFKQERVGKDGKKFLIFKLRTMKTNKELEQRRDMSKDNERKTKWGNILRRFKIDELPQLLNVIKGDMSLVGPRPTVIEQVNRYTIYEAHRLDMKPGMTGLAQINGNGGLSWKERIEYDLIYIKKFSIGLDIYILINTIKVVLFGETKYIHKLDKQLLPSFKEIVK